MQFSFSFNCSNKKLSYHRRLSAFGIPLAAYCAMATSVGGLTIATMSSVAIIAFGVLWFRFGNAVWMYLDHIFHPLQQRDRLSATSDERPQ